MKLNPKIWGPKYVRQYRIEWGECRHNMGNINSAMYYIITMMIFLQSNFGSCFFFKARNRIRNLSIMYKHRKLHSIFYYIDIVITNARFSQIFWLLKKGLWKKDRIRLCVGCVSGVFYYKDISYNINKPISLLFCSSPVPHFFGLDLMV